MGPRMFSRFVAQGVLFVAILADGSVVTWGAPDHGGDSSRVQEQLSNVQQISGADLAFGATLADHLAWWHEALSRLWW